MERGLGEYYHSPVVKRKEESIGEKAVCYICKEHFFEFCAESYKKFPHKDQLYIRKYYSSNFLLLSSICSTYQRRKNSGAIYAQCSVGA